MKFRYEYQDKTNRRHFGVLSAPSRAEAYAALKAQGIKPIRCEEAPGVLNAVFGKGKRWIAIAVLASAVTIVAVLYLRVSGALRTVERSRAFQTLQEIESSFTRRQVLGDAAIIERGIRTAWASVFTKEGDRFLASFAIPGVQAGMRSTTETALKQSLECEEEEFLTASADAQTMEARQIRAMVKGMKQELRRFLENGGTITEYGQRLVERQEKEIQYYRLAKADIENAIAEGRSDKDVQELWEKHNAALRKMGIRTILYPEDQ